MSGHATGMEWQEAQARVLLEEFRRATGDAANSLDDAKTWFAGLALAERDRISRWLNDSEVVGRYLETPRMH